MPVHDVPTYRQPSLTSTLTSFNAPQPSPDLADDTYPPTNVPLQAQLYTSPYSGGLGYSQSGVPAQKSTQQLFGLQSATSAGHHEPSPVDALYTPSSDIASGCGPDPEGLDPRLLEHLFNLVQTPSPSFMQGWKAQSTSGATHNQGSNNFDHRWTRPDARGTQADDPTSYNIAWNPSNDPNHLVAPQSSVCERTDLRPPSAGSSANGNIIYEPQLPPCPSQRAEGPTSAIGTAPRPFTDSHGDVIHCNEPAPYAAHTLPSTSLAQHPLRGDVDQESTIHARHTVSILNHVASPVPRLFVAVGGHASLEFPSMQVDQREETNQSHMDTVTTTTRQDTQPRIASQKKTGTPPLKLQACHPCVVDKRKHCSFEHHRKTPRTKDPNCVRCAKLGRECYMWGSDAWKTQSAINPDHFEHCLSCLHSSSFCDLRPQTKEKCGASTVLGLACRSRMRTTYWRVENATEDSQQRFIEWLATEEEPASPSSKDPPPPIL